MISLQCRLYAIKQGSGETFCFGVRCDHKTVSRVQAVMTVNKS